MKSYDIDFIKWMCEKVGIKFFCRSVDMCQYAVRIGRKSTEIGSNNWEDIVSPLLLQRAIEGVNSLGKWSILIYVNEITVESMVNDTDYFYHDFVENKTTVDQAKESALKYIYEQEKK